MASHNVINETGAIDVSGTSQSEARNRAIGTIDLSQKQVPVYTASNNKGSEIETIDLSAGSASNAKDRFTAKNISSTQISNADSCHSLRSVFGGSLIDTHGGKSNTTNLPARTRKSKFKAPRAILQAASANQPNSSPCYAQSKPKLSEAGALQFIGQHWFIVCTGTNKTISLHAIKLTT